MADTRNPQNPLHDGLASQHSGKDQSALLLKLCTNISKEVCNLTNFFEDAKAPSRCSHQSSVFFTLKAKVFCPFFTIIGISKH